MRYYEISYEQFGNTYQVLLSGLPMNTSIDLLVNLMSEFGPVEDLELFHTIDEEEELSTFCQVYFETIQAAFLAATCGFITYKDHNVVVESIHEILGDDIEHFEDQKPQIKALLSSSADNDETNSSSSSRLKKWYHAHLIRVESEKIRKDELCANNKPSALKQMLSQTVKNQNYCEAQKMSQNQKGGLRFQKNTKKQCRK